VNGIPRTDPLQKEPTLSPTTSPTKAPSQSPTPPPSTSPTLSPSSLPSLQPSIVEEIVRTSGSLSVNSDICGFNEDQLAAFIEAALTSIQDIACVTTSCIAEILSACGNSSARRNRSLSSRGLQNTEAWQVAYEVTETFICRVASCNSEQDTAAASSIVDSITDSLTTSIESGSFVSVLSSNIMSAPSSLDASITTCLVAWGVVDEPTMEVAQPEGTGIYYPDWVGESATCLQDGQQPLHMDLDPSLWLYDSLEGCCDRYFSGWNKNKCMNKRGSGLWYVKDATGKCAVDCEEGNGSICGGLAAPFSDDLFADPKSCCESKLNWLLTEFCEADSLGDNCYCGTGKWYRGDTAGSDVCVRDCDESCGGSTCGGIIEHSHVVLHDSAEACCTSEYEWMETELCATRSTKTPIEKYWPDKTNSKCVNDSETPAEDFSVSLFDTVEACCTAGIPWLSEAACMATTDEDAAAATPRGSGKYYIDWIHERCVMDDGSDGIVAEAWDDLFDDVTACCDSIPWIEREDCVVM